MARRFTERLFILLCGSVLFGVCEISVFATPANKAALEHHYDKFLDRNLASCTTCHLPSENKDPQSLDEFPHNPFGVRLRKVRTEIDTKDIAARLKRIATEDSDGDGVENEKEL